MKVKCNKIFNAAGENLSDDKDFRLIRGNEYIVIAIRIIPNWGVFICLLDEEYSPFFTPLVGFEVISQKIPATWGLRMDEQGDVEIIPNSWIKIPSFFENLEDGDAATNKIFYDEAAHTYEEEGVKAPWIK